MSFALAKSFHLQRLKPWYGYATVLDKVRVMFILGAIAGYEYFNALFTDPMPLFVSITV